MESAQISNIILLVNSSWRLIKESEVYVRKGEKRYFFLVSHKLDDLSTHKETIKMYIQWNNNIHTIERD